MKLIITLALNSDKCDNALECYQLAKGACTTIEVRMFVKSTQVLNSERWENAPKCYQLAKGTRSSDMCKWEQLSKQIIYILVKCMYLSLSSFVYIGVITAGILKALQNSLIVP